MANLKSTNITGSLNISGSGPTGSIVLNVTGSAGTLFIVDDVNSGSLFNVNSPVGLPVLEAFSDGTVNIGKYGSEGVKVKPNGDVSIGDAIYISSSGTNNIPLGAFPNDVWINSEDGQHRFYFASNGNSTFKSNGEQMNLPFNFSNGVGQSGFYAGDNNIVGTPFSNYAIVIGSGNANYNYSVNNGIFMGYNAGGKVNYAYTNYGYIMDNSNFFGNKAGYLQNNYYNSNYNNANNSNFFGYHAGSMIANVNYIANNAYNSNFFGNSAGKVINGNYSHNASNSNFFGASSGYDAYNANDSNFFGQNAGYNAYNASNSNFFGQSAGNGAYNARYSNFFGQNAGNGATYANNSIFIGNNAGIGDTVNNGVGPKSSILIGDYTSTGGNSDSIAIGKGTRNNATKQFNIGNVLYGLNIYAGSTSTSTPQTNGKVGIGTNNPSNTLSVAGNISASAITASIITSNALITPQSSSYIDANAKFTGSMFYSGSKLYIYTGTGNAGGLAGWQTASLGG